MSNDDADNNAEDAAAQKPKRRRKAGGLRVPEDNVPRRPSKPPTEDNPRQALSVAYAFGSGEAPGGEAPSGEAPEGAAEPSVVAPQTSAEPSAPVVASAPVASAPVVSSAPVAAAPSAQTTAVPPAVVATSASTPPSESAQSPAAPGVDLSALGMPEPTGDSVEIAFDDDDDGFAASLFPPDEPTRDDDPNAADVDSLVEAVVQAAQDDNRTQRNAPPSSVVGTINNNNDANVASDNTDNVGQRGSGEGDAADDDLDDDDDGPTTVHVEQSATGPAVEAVEPAGGDGESAAPRAHRRIDTQPGFGGASVEEDEGSDAYAAIEVAQLAVASTDGEVDDFSSTMPLKILTEGEQAGASAVAEEIDDPLAVLPSIPSLPPPAPAVVRSADKPSVAAASAAGPRPSVPQADVKPADAGDSGEVLTEDLMEEVKEQVEPAAPKEVPVAETSGAAHAPAGKSGNGGSSAPASSESGRRAQTLVDNVEEISGSEIVEVEEASGKERVATPPPAPKAGARTKPPPAPKPAPVASKAAAPRKRKGKPWFEEIFDEDYLRTLPFLTPRATQREADFTRQSLDVEPGAQLLDVGCGYGRHAMEFAARGYHVVGLDQSLPLLIRGADEAQRRGLNINFVHGDMREPQFEAQFDGAYCLFSTFGYFDDEINRKTAQNVARALKPGARFVVDVLNRDYLVADLPSRVWWEGDGCVVLEEVEFNYFSSRIMSRRSVVFDDGRQLEQEISVRCYSLHELGKLFHAAGFRVLEISGSMNTRGRFLGPQSRSIVVVCERRESNSPA